MPETDLLEAVQGLRKAVQELKQEIADLHEIAQALSHRLRRIEER